MKSQEVLEILESLRPASAGVSSVLAMVGSSVNMYVSSDSDPSVGAVITARGGVSFAVTVAGDFMHIIEDDDASATEIRSYLAFLVAIGLQFLRDRPRPTSVGWGPPRIVLAVDGHRVMLCGTPRHRAWGRFSRDRQ